MNAISPDAPLIDAATVLVLREAVTRFEVFMVKRHGKSSFMPNAWVYPGGRLDPADTAPAVLDRLERLEPEQIRASLGVASATRAAGLYLAGIRETFEEAGIFLARRRGGAGWLDLVHEDHAPVFAAYRRELQEHRTPLSAVAEAEDLVFPADELAFFAHWITPTFEPRRFDTFFFVARAPRRQEPLHDDRETTASEWIAPQVALDRFESGDIYLAPPTIRTLARLADFPSIDAVFAATRAGLPPTIIPHLVQDGETPVLLLPGDPDFPADDPTYALATPVTQGATRMVLKLPRT